MLERLVKWQGNGQGLNNKLQLIIISLLSLATGVLGTLIFQSSQKSVELVQSMEFKKEEKDQKEFIEDRRPFFIKSEVEKNNSQPEKSVSSLTDDTPSSSGTVEKS